MTGKIIKFRPRKAAAAAVSLLERAFGGTSKLKDAQERERLMGLPPLTEADVAPEIERIRAELPDPPSWPDDQGQA